MSKQLQDEKGAEKGLESRFDKMRKDVTDIQKSEKELKK